MGGCISSCKQKSDDVKDHIEAVIGKETLDQIAEATKQAALAGATAAAAAAVSEIGKSGGTTAEDVAKSALLAAIGASSSSALQFAKDNDIAPAFLKQLEIYADKISDYVFGSHLWKNMPPEMKTLVEKILIEKLSPLDKQLDGQLDILDDKVEIIGKIIGSKLKADQLDSFEDSQAQILEAITKLKKLNVKDILDSVELNPSKEIFVGGPHVPDLEARSLGTSRVRTSQKSLFDIAREHEIYSRPQPSFTPLRDSRIKKHQKPLSHSAGLGTRVSFNKEYSYSISASEEDDVNNVTLRFKK